MSCSPVTQAAASHTQFAGATSLTAHTSESARWHSVEQCRPSLPSPTLPLLMLPTCEHAFWRQWQRSMTKVQCMHCMPRELNCTLTTPTHRHTHATQNAALQQHLWKALGLKHDVARQCLVQQCYSPRSARRVSGGQQWQLDIVLDSMRNHHSLLSNATAHIHTHRGGCREAAPR